MDQIIIENRPFWRSRFFQIGAVVALMLAMAAVLVWPRAMRRFDRWSAARRVQRAADFYAKGDFQHAALDARSALEGNPRNAEAVRMVAKSLESMGSPGAIQWRRHLDSMIPGDPENTLAWAKDALAAGDAATATNLLDSMKPADRNVAPWHDLMAHIALGKQDVKGANTHWTEAANLDPKEESYRLSLATLQAGSGTPGARERALEVLNELSSKPDQQLVALRALLADAMNHGEAAKAKELALKISSDPNSDFTDKLARLALLRKLKDPDATSFLLDLKKHAMSKQEDLSPLLLWMNEHGLSLMVMEWAAELPPEVTAKPPVCIAVTDARARNLDWEKIEDTLFSASWGEADHLRQAYRTRALEHLSEEDKANAPLAWEAALLAAGKRTAALETLAKLAAAWGWERRAEEALWKVSTTDQCPPWVRLKLWDIAIKHADAQQMRLVAKLMAEADPRSITDRNNAICLGLLIRSPDAKLHEQAAALYKDAPDNLDVASTYGLSLFQRGRAEDALAVMEKFTPEQLREPNAARYYGIFLSASDRHGEAEEFLKLGEQGFVLPEETALIGRTRAAAAGN